MKLWFCVISIASISFFRSNSYSFTSGPHADSEKTIVTSLSEKYSTPADRIRYLRELRYGYEEIVPALIVAKEAQVEAGRVLRMRTEGKSWNETCGFFSVDAKKTISEANAFLEPWRKKLPKKALKDKPNVIVENSNGKK